MKRGKTSSEKVLRAIGIGMAAMMVVAQTPVSVLANEQDPDADNNQMGVMEDQKVQIAQYSEPQTIDESVTDAASCASEADQYTGNMDTEEPAKEASGTVGTKAQDVIDAADACSSAIGLDEELENNANAISSAIDNICEEATEADGKAELGQVQDEAENTAQKVEEVVGEGGVVDAAVEAASELDGIKDNVKTISDTVNDATTAVSTVDALKEQTQNNAQEAVNAKDAADEEYQKGCQQIEKQIMDVLDTDKTTDTIDAEDAVKNLEDLSKKAGLSS